MCENRDGKFVVPKKPSAGIGWWIGEAIGEISPALHMSGKVAVLCQVSILHVQNAGYNGSPFIVAGDLEEFDSLPQALAHLAGIGVMLV